jgi:hypothetical protein
MSDTNVTNKPSATVTMVLDEAGRAHIDSMHKLGIIGSAIAIVVMLGIPTITGLFFNAMPTFAQLLAASIGILALFVPVAVSEVIAYTPILGSSIYLAMITGNLSNLKLPIGNQALTLLDVEAGTEDADIVTSIAISVSSFSTIIIILIGVLLLLPLRPILTNPTVRTASGYIVPALFGSLSVGALGSSIGGGIRTEGRLKSVILPAVLVAAVNILFVYILKQPIIIAMYQGFLILILLHITWYWAKFLYKTNQIKVILPGEK